MNTDERAALVAEVRSAIREQALDRFLSDYLADDARDWVAGFTARAAVDAIYPTPTKGAPE